MDKLGKIKVELEVGTYEEMEVDDLDFEAIKKIEERNKQVRKKKYYEKKIFSLSKDIEQMLENPPSEGDEDFQKISNLSVALNSPFSEVERYWEYINGQASFDTHQGVKGLEFERVMVIIDDSAARSNTFSYDKLFGFEPKSDTDIKNESEGRDTTLDRTRRLLYVTCSRAMDSLAIVYYTDDVEKVYSALLDNAWFDQEEIICI